MSTSSCSSWGIGSFVRVYSRTENVRLNFHFHFGEKNEEFSEYWGFFNEGNKYRGCIYDANSLLILGGLISEKLM